MKKSLLQTSASLGRISESESESLSSQLNVYQVLDSKLLLPFNDGEDRVDDWWCHTFGVIEKQIGEEPLALRKLVKMCLSLPHGNAFLERGFSTSKSVASGRERLNLKNFKSQKIVYDTIKKHGGTQNVPINFKLINAVKRSHVEMIKAKDQEAKEKEMNERREKDEEESRKKKQKIDDERKSWDLKVKEEIKQLKITIRTQEDIQKENITKASRGNAKTDIRAHLAAAEMVMKSLSENTRKLWTLQDQLNKLMLKKPSQ